jgi:glycosyltransferase involved in cell wall biosynthesis
MKIGFNLLYIKGNLNGGTAVYGLSMLETLSEQRPSDDLIAFIRKGENVLNGKSRNIEKCEISMPRGAGGRVTAEQSLLPIVAQRKGVELMFSPAFVSPVFGRFKKVTTIHDIYFKVHPQATRMLQRLYWKAFIPASLACSDRIVVSSTNTYHDLVKHYPWVSEKCKVIHCAPNKRLVEKAYISRKSSKPQGRYVVFVSNITPNKNVETLIRAIVELNRCGQKIGLCVIGNDVRGILKRTIEELGAHKVVDRRGYVGEDDLVDIVRSAICLVVPSKYEGFGMTVLEGMLLEVPVIVSNAASLPEVAGDGALLFDPYSVDELCQKLMMLLGEGGEAVRQDLVRRGSENLKRFSWEKSAMRLHQLFLELQHETPFAFKQ